MKTLTATASIAEITNAFNTFNIELTVDDGFMSLWKGQKFITKFVESQALALEILNREIAAHNDRNAEIARKSAHKAEVTAGFTAAAVLCERGSVIGECKAGATEKSIRVCDFSDGQPVNVHYYKISRSAANLEKARKIPGYFAENVVGDQCFYEFVTYNLS